MTTGAESIAERTRAAACPEPEVRVLVRGDQRSYELRERLKAAGMRWMPETHAWSGTVPESFVSQMETEGLQTVPLVPEGHPLDRQMREERKEQESLTTAPREAPTRKPRTRKKAPVRVSDEERANAFLPEHRWELQDITAGLSGDDRADDEQRVERHLKDLRARVKATRALISADPALQQTLATNREKARAFYAIHGVTEAQVRHGVPDVDVQSLEGEDLVALLRNTVSADPTGVDWTGEEAERAAAVLPGSEVGA